MFQRDADAMQAKRWAVSKRIDMPGTLSILSLGPGSRLFAENISCCMPDYATTGYLMAHGILGDIPIPKSNKKIAVKGHCGFCQVIDAQATPVPR